MLQELILEGADCYSISRQFRTPLLDIFARNFEDRLFRSEGSSSSLLKSLARGTCLQWRGSRAVRPKRKRTFRAEIRLLGFCRSGSRQTRTLWRLAKLSYGKQPSEWTVTMEKYEVPLANNGEHGIPEDWLDDYETLKKIPA